VAVSSEVKEHRRKAKGIGDGFFWRPDNGWADGAGRRGHVRM